MRRGFQDGAIHVNADFNHRIGFIGVFLRQQLRAARTKGVLGRSDDCVVLFEPSGNVQQHKQDPGWADPDKIIKVAARGPAIRDGRQLGFL